MSYLDLLKQELFGNPKTAISDIKISPGENSQNYSSEEIAETVLKSIKDVKNGGGRDIDLNY